MSKFCSSPRSAWALRLRQWCVWDPWSWSPSAGGPWSPTAKSSGRWDKFWIQCHCLFEISHLTTIVLSRFVQNFWCICKVKVLERYSFDRQLQFIRRTSYFSDHWIPSIYLPGCGWRRAPGPRWHRPSTWSSTSASSSWPSWGRPSGAARSAVRRFKAKSQTEILLL